MNLDSLNNITEQVASNAINAPASSLGLGADIVLILMILAGFILGFFYLFKKYVIPLLESVKDRKKIKLLILRTEVITWLVFALFALTQLFTENLWVTVALLIVIGLVGFNFWRDFFPGLLIRVSRKIRQRDPVRYKEFDGTVVKLGYTSLSIKTEAEELIFIPYRKITDGVFVRRQAKGKLISTKLVYPVHSKNPDELVDKINNWMKACPWAILQAGNSAAVQKGGVINISLYAVDAVSLSKAERFIRGKIESLG